MSDIPVGSPPAPPGRHAAPGGWYADPVDPAQERYWDGWQWSRTTRSREAPAVRPAAAYAPGISAVGARPGQQVATADGVPLAGWGWRVLAALLDGVITAIVVTAATFPIYRSTVQQLNELIQAMVAARQAGTPVPTLDVTTLYTTQQRWTLMVAMLAVGLVYHVVFLRWKRATVGKLVCGLRVVPLDQGQYAGRLSWATVVVRAAVWVVPAVIGALVLLRLADALLPLWQAKRQSLHDLLARTQVVRPDQRQLFR